VAPRKIDHAIYEGELAGRELWTYTERTICDGDLERMREAGVDKRLPLLLQSLLNRT
jgi:hypothetical protein